MVNVRESTSLLILSLLNHSHKPPFWAIRFGPKSVILPCGGAIDRFAQLTRQPVETSVGIDRMGLWTRTQFGIASAFALSMKHETDVTDLDFVGGLLEILTQEGDVWEWIIVDYQGDEIVALPLRRKSSAQDADGAGVMMMVGKHEFVQREDLSEFQLASPSKLISLTVNR